MVSVAVQLPTDVFCNYASVSSGQVKLHFASEMLRLAVVIFVPVLATLAVARNITYGNYNSDDIMLVTLSQDIPFGFIHFHRNVTYFAVSKMVG